MGDNGAGKSTLVKTIAGIHRADDGEILFDGQEVKINSPTDATDLGIATVYQDLALCDNLDVVENLFLGARSSGRVLYASSTRRRWSSGPTTCSSPWRSRSPTCARRSARCPAASASRWPSPARCSASPKVVMLDEPTAALGVRQTAQVLALIKRLREQGHGVVVISHNLADVFEVADRIFVLRLGQAGGRLRRAARHRREEIVGAITGAGQAHDGAGGER